MDWDEELTGAELSEWQSWLRELSEVEALKVPRCLKTSVSGEVKRMELHLFSDASEKAFAAVVAFN